MKQFKILIAGLVFLSLAQVVPAQTTLVFFPARSNEPPASAPATPLSRVNIPILQFVDASDTCAEFGGFMPQQYAAGGVNVVIGWMAESATTGAVSWDAAFKSVTDDADDLDTKAYAANNNVSATTASASGEVDHATIAFTDGADMDSVAAGEYFRLRVCRDGDGTTSTDSLTENAQFLWAAVEEP
jgi:hypothetical protein